MSREAAVPSGNPPRFSPSAAKAHKFLLRRGFSLLRSRRYAWAAGLLLLAGLASGYEMHTSAIEAQLFFALAARLSYSMGKGRSPNIVFPSGGPLNITRGYSSLPQFLQHLGDAGFQVVEQARISSGLETLQRLNVAPPYPEPPSAGLLIRDENGKALYDAASRNQAFTSYDEIPALAVQALLFVEDRELADASIPTRNPAIDWDRLGWAGVLYSAGKLGFHINVEGGSTLATQLEKFLYSDGGRTHSADDKFRQMLAASLRVYASGTDTSAERKSIVVDYMNFVPLGATAGYGEVNGIDNGLHVWFGMELDDVLKQLRDTAPEAERARIFRRVLALICAARAPTFYLSENRQALQNRVDFYTRQLERNGIISPRFAHEVESTPLEFQSRAPAQPPVPFVERKASTAIRKYVMSVTGVRDLYTLDRLRLTVDSTLNANLQQQVLELLSNLKKPEFIEASGLRQSNLLQSGDPRDVTYSFTLFERTADGNLLRVQADTLNQPFDLNEGMKLELGSTAKLRTLAHYLELVTSLYREYRTLDKDGLARYRESARDPITVWVGETMYANPELDLAGLLDRSLDRQYSASPDEVFFTGGGAHTFSNFDHKEDGAFYTVRDGLKFSVNLAYIRLMRDLVRFHEARLPYNIESVLNRQDDPQRLQMLQEISQEESEHSLDEAYRNYHARDSAAILDSLLGNRGKSPRELALVFLASHPKADTETLYEWMMARGATVSENDVSALLKAYDPGHLNISDYGYLLNRNPLDVWVAGQLMQNPDESWESLLGRSGSVREMSSRWLLQTKNRHAQDLRLRTRIEQDAFARMTPYWQRLGFPFDRLVPSLASAIGSSADRPIALAELTGIIVNDGIRLPLLRIQRMRFAGDTPYETVLEPVRSAGVRVMEPEVARALRNAMTGVVEGGTAGRLAGAFLDGDGRPIVAGGKTGSGDNRFETFGPGGKLKSSRAVSRTGTFTFFIGDRYFGVLTAYVDGDHVGDFGFTSALPVTALKMLAPAIMATLNMHVDSKVSWTK